MSGLDDLPDVDSLMGIDLKNAVYIIAALCIVHPVFYGCTLFTNISYHIVTIWILVAIFCGASVALLAGIIQSDVLLMVIWLWYSLFFVVIMFIMMMILALVFCSRGQSQRLVIVVLAILWYILTVYFILVVNSYRKSLEPFSDLTLGLMEENISDTSIGSSQNPSTTSKPYANPPEMLVTTVAGLKEEYQ